MEGMQIKTIGKTIRTTKLLVSKMMYMETYVIASSEKYQNGFLKPLIVIKRCRNGVWHSKTRNIGRIQYNSIEVHATKEGLTNL